MADILSRICSLSPQPHHSKSSDLEYDSQIQDLLAYLRQITFNETSDIVSNDSSLLDVGEPCTLLARPKYILLLNMSCNEFEDVKATRRRSNEPFPEDVHPRGKLWSRAIQFLVSFDPIQMRYAGREWRELVELFAQSALAVSMPLLAVHPIRGAMLRMDTSCAVLTSTHLVLIRLCLYARAYTFALPVLDKPIYHFPTGSGQTYQRYSQTVPCVHHEQSAYFMADNSGLSAKITYREHLEYFLYGAMIYMALKEWKKAVHFLTIVISCPVVGSVSMIMVEAYKKWILVSLLGGKLARAPEAISSHTMKIYQLLAKPYLSLAGAYESGDFLRLETEVENGWSVWKMDGNIGLVHQVLCAFKKSTFYRLGTTFAALAVTDATDRAGICSALKPDMESFIASLIMAKALDATLSHSSHADSTMLRFLGMSSRSKEPYMQAQLTEGSLSLANLMDYVEEANHSLGVSEECIESLQRNRKHCGGAYMSSIRESGGFDIEEDIMGGL